MLSRMRNPRTAEVSAAATAGNVKAPKQRRYLSCHVRFLFGKAAKLSPTKAVRSKRESAKNPANQPRHLSKESKHVVLS